MCCSCFCCCCFCVSIFWGPGTRVTNGNLNLEGLPATLFIVLLGLQHACAPQLHIQAYQLFDVIADPEERNDLSVITAWSPFPCFRRLTQLALQSNDGAAGPATGTPLHYPDPDPPRFSFLLPSSPTPSRPFAHLSPPPGTANSSTLRSSKSSRPCTLLNVRWRCTLAFAARPGNRTRTGCCSRGCMPTTPASRATKGCTRREGRRSSP